MSKRKKQRRRRSHKPLIIILIILILLLIAVGIYLYINWTKLTQPDVRNEPAATEQPADSVEVAPADEPNQQPEQKPAPKEPSKPHSTTTQQGGYTTTTTDAPVFSEPTISDERFEINYPSKVADNQVVQHISYTLSYNNKYEQADWVFYLLTRAMVRGKEKRATGFEPDPQVKLLTAVSSDYTNSGYDRGHLCPSADVRHNNEAQKETFYMSNISPQLPDFNRGIWKRLEEQVRRFAEAHDSIYVVTGPVLTGKMATIGKRNKVAVPKYFYKVIYSPHDGGHMIGFLLPNAGSESKITSFIITVDEIEELTGVDFFPNVTRESELEATLGNFRWWQQREK